MEDDNGDNNGQYIAPGGTGHQYNGQGHHIYSGPGMTINIDAATDTFENSRKQILQALDTSPYLQRKNRNPDRVAGTCEWFLNHPDFHNWRDSTSSSMLWVSANPGCGKSVLAKCLVDELKTTKERTTCYFFFKDDFEDQRSAKSALSCILHQLFVQKKNLLSGKIMDRLKSYKAPLADSYYDLWELWDILIMASQDTNAGEIVCILDAFDECEDKDRQDLANIVRKFYIQTGSTKQSVNLKFFITSRPYDNIRLDLVPFNLEDVPVIHLKGDGDKETKMIAEEISLFIKERVSQVRKKFGLTEKEEEFLLHKLGAVPSQTYLWVYLTLDWIETEIHNKISEMEIHNAVSVLPRTVDEAYDKILSKSIDVAETKKLLHIVVAAERPLTLDEMDLALAVQQHHDSYKDLKRRPSDRFKKYIRDLCGLFIHIRDEKIYLLHQTAKEFLVPRGHQESQEGVMPQRGHVSQVDRHKQLTWRSSLIPSESHRVIFKACVWYLLFIKFQASHPKFGHELLFSEEEARIGYDHEFVFLDYSAKNWAAHFRASGIEAIVFREQLQQICDAKSKLCWTWFRVYWADNHPGVIIPSKFTTLMVASYLGIEIIVRLQLQSPDVKLDVVDNIFERSALSWASENGFESIVTLLIKGRKLNLRNVQKSGFHLSFFRGATVDTKDKTMRTPLFYASLNGHLSVVRILAHAGARADLKDRIGGTPISYALCTGRQDIANELTTQAQEFSINEIRDGLLLSAVENGHQLIAKRLLDSGADIEAVNKNNKTPLFIASWYRHTALAQLLIERGANIKAASKNNETPLFVATRHGDRALAQLFIERGADIEAVNKNNETPLFIASWYRHTALAQLFIERGAKITAVNKNNETPLFVATRHGNRALAQLLIERGADIEAVNKNNETPLFIATRHRYIDLAQTFLGTGANIEAVNKDNETPLFFATRYGNSDLAKLLIERGANIEALNKDNETPLFIAIRDENKPLAQLLVEKGANLEAVNKNNETPLFIAIQYRHRALAQYLISMGAAVDLSKEVFGWVFPFSCDDGR